MQDSNYRVSLCSRILEDLIERERRGLELVARIKSGDTKLLSS